MQRTTGPEKKQNDNLVVVVVVENRKSRLEKRLPVSHLIIFKKGVWRLLGFVHYTRRFVDDCKTIFREWKKSTDFKGNFSQVLKEKNPNTDVCEL